MLMCNLQVTYREEPNLIQTLVKKKNQCYNVGQSKRNIVVKF